MALARYARRQCRCRPIAYPESSRAVWSIGGFLWSYYLLSRPSIQISIPINSRVHRARTYQKQLIIYDNRLWCVQQTLRRCHICACGMYGGGMYAQRLYGRDVRKANWEPLGSQCAFRSQAYQLQMLCVYMAVMRPAWTNERALKIWSPSVHLKILLLSMQMARLSFSVAGDHGLWLEKRFVVFLLGWNPASAS